MYLERISSPKDMKGLNLDELNVLADELRETLIQKLSVHGGHIGPNLGMVEMTCALHYVFESPTDKIVYDVSHQSYNHKMLTGRKEAFLSEAHYDDVSGYTNPNESEHDFFNIGHTSTSISLACGLAKGRDLQQQKGNVIAIIGDGSLSGGEAYEGLNNVVEQGTNMIVILNDNDMSIAENHGGIYNNLKELRENKGQAKHNVFEAIGFEYHYLEDGHNLKDLVDVFSKVKDIDHPVLLHIHTIKGKGLTYAETNKEAWHYGMPFEVETGKSKMSFKDAKNYGTITADYLLAEMKKDPAVVAITSATPTVFGFTADKRQEAGKQFVDVGIAEEHAVAFASGIAKNGGKPVYGVYSTFLQRTYDQISQDLCINNNSALILVNAASVYAMNDITHIGLYDIGLLSNIPNFVYLAPTNMEEYMAMLSYGLHQKEHPMGIRVPAMGVVETGMKDTTDYSILNKYKITQKGKKVAILALGDFYQLGENLTSHIKKTLGWDATLINPKFITGLDEDVLNQLKAEHELVITLEDGVLEGGFGEKIARFFGPEDMKVKNYGVKKEWLDRYDPQELMQRNRITKEQITEDIASILK